MRRLQRMLEAQLYRQTGRSAARRLADTQPARLGSSLMLYERRGALIKFLKRVATSLLSKS
jgi:hypothetical protein